MRKLSHIIVGMALPVLAAFLMQAPATAEKSLYKAVGEAVAAGHRSLLALSTVVGIAVLREGSEIVLFLYGIAISGNDTAATIAAGGAFGLLLGGVGAASMYFGLLRIPARHLFRVTSWLIAVLAAGMAAQAIAFLQRAHRVVFGGLLVGAAWVMTRSSQAAYLAQAIAGVSAGAVYGTCVGNTLKWFPDHRGSARKC